jgi:hypothetical protein
MPFFIEIAQSQGGPTVTEKRGRSKGEKVFAGLPGGLRLEKILDMV